MNNYASDSSSNSDVDDENSREFSEDNYVAKMSITPLRSIGPLGEWEMYTRVCEQYFRPFVIFLIFATPSLTTAYGTRESQFSY